MERQKITKLNRFNGFLLFFIRYIFVLKVSLSIKPMPSGKHTHAYAQTCLVQTRPPTVTSQTRKHRFTFKVQYACTWCHLSESNSSQVHNSQMECSEEYTRSYYSIRVCLSQRYRRHQILLNVKPNPLSNFSVAIYSTGMSSM